jgi:hypothetical protein
VGFALCMRAWSRGSPRPTRPELEPFIIFLAWAAFPTATLVAVSLFKPVYFDHYVTASAPGLALVVGLVTDRALDLAAAGWAARARSVIGGIAVVVTALVIFWCSVPAAQQVSENLRGAARYVAVHVGRGSEVALPDHSLTAGIDFYLRSDHETVATWPQLAAQPYIEGLDLKQDRRTLSRAPNDVWLVDDGSVTGTSAFVRVLGQAGYVRSDTTHLVGVAVVHFRRLAG